MVIPLHLKGMGVLKTGEEGLQICGFVVGRFDVESKAKIGATHVPLRSREFLSNIYVVFLYCVIMRHVYS